MIRLATTDDAASILEIYRPAIEGSATSFETVVPSFDEMCTRIENCLKVHPWIVDIEAGELRGYSYAGVYHPRAAYRWSAIVSVFVADEFARRGVASRLYRALFALLEQQGIRQVLAAISLSNVVSHTFHEDQGFRKVGVMPDVGYKLDQWQSMGWWQRPVGEGAESEPNELIPFDELVPKLPDDLTSFASENC